MNSIRHIRKITAPTFTLMLLALYSKSGFAQSNESGATILASDLLVSINALWVIIAALFVLFMQAGFALVESGFTRAKNVANTMSMVLMVFAIAALCYWAVGFAFQFGGLNQSMPDLGSGIWVYAPQSLGDWGDALGKELAFGNHGVLGLSGFMLSGLGENFGILAFFFFHFALAATATTIPTGAVAERMKWSGYLLMTVLMAALVYPLIGNWSWGGGWLANLGRSLYLGNGFVDFAGSGVIHMTGGAMALAGTLVIGPRIGKYNRDNSANVIAGHNVPMGILGSFILIVGWFALNAGATLGFTGELRVLAIHVVVNTLLAIAASGVSAMIYTMLASSMRRPDPATMVNGLLAGAVAIGASCAFVDGWAAVVIGLIAGMLVCGASVVLNKIRIDDPIGVIPIHLVCGAWGVLAVAIFANGGVTGAGWNGVSSGVMGLISANHAGNMSIGLSQLFAQIIATVAIFVTAFGVSYVVFKVAHSMGIMRVTPDIELAGLDVAEMGTEGYPADFEPSIESLRNVTYAS